MAVPHPAPQATKQRIDKLSYTHEAMIDLIIAEPTASAIELAEVFGYSAGWISRIVASDAFQSRLAERKARLTDPVIAHTLDERLRGVAIHSIALIQEKLTAEESADYAIDALGLATTAMGMYKRAPQ
jgi:hypothetical protein